MIFFQRVHFQFWWMKISEENTSHVQLHLVRYHIALYLGRFHKNLMFISLMPACKTYSPPFPGRNTGDFDLNCISKETKTISSYCLLVKTTPLPPFDPPMFSFPFLAEKSEFPAVLFERPRRPEPDAGSDY